MSSLPVIVGIRGRYQSGKDTIARMIKDMVGDTTRVELRSFAIALKRVLNFMFPSVSLESMETDEGKNQPLPPWVTDGQERRGNVFLVYLIMRAFDKNPESVTLEQVNEYMRTLCGHLDMKVECPITEVFNRIYVALDTFTILYHTAQGTMTVGQALQKLGTECFRNCVHADFWVAVARTNIESAAPTDHSMPTLIVFTDVRFPNEYKYIHGEEKHLLVEVQRKVDYSKSSRDPLHPSECALDGYSFDVHVDNNGTLADTKEIVSTAIIPRISAMLCL